MRSLALALSWLTVLPVRTGEPSPRTAAGALRWVPLVGALLGFVAGAVVWVAFAAGIPWVVAGLLGVAVLQLGTRGMHADGLADTADGLGCYGPPDRALAVMRNGGAGPFGVVTLLVVLGVQAGSMGANPGWRGPLIVALACATGRVGFLWVARRGVPAARPGGLGATVAGSQPAWLAPLCWIVFAAAGYLLLGSWRGAAAIVLAALLTILLSAHTRRRFGGMTGDVLGAAAELGTAAALVVLVSLP